MRPLSGSSYVLGGRGGEEIHGQNETSEILLPKGCRRVWHETKRQRNPFHNLSTSTIAAKDVTNLENVTKVLRWSEHPLTLVEGRRTVVFSY